MVLTYPYLDTIWIQITRIISDIGLLIAMVSGPYMLMPSERNVMAKTENGRSGKRTGGEKIFLLDTRPRLNPGTILRKVLTGDDRTAVGSGRGGT